MKGTTNSKNNAKVLDMKTAKRDHYETDRQTDRQTEQF